MCAINKTMLAGLVVSALLQACAGAPLPPGQPLQVKSASSGLMLEVSLEELVDLSDRVILGTVTGQQSRWNTAHTAINTLVSMDVSRWVKGAPAPGGSNSLVITVPGGRVDNQAQEVEDVPKFSNGEQVLLFLKSGSEGAFEVAGGFQGKYSIVAGNAVPCKPAESLPLEDLIARITAITAK